MTVHTETEAKEEPRIYLPVSTGAEERMLYTGEIDFEEWQQLVNVEEVGLSIYNSDNHICDSTLSLLALIHCLESSYPELGTRLGVSTQIQDHPEGKVLYLPNSKGFKGAPSPLIYHWSITKVGVGVENSGLVYNKESGIAYVAYEEAGEMVVDRLANAKIFKPPVDYFTGAVRQEISLATKQLEAAGRLNLEILMAAAKSSSLPVVNDLPAHTLSTRTYLALLGGSDPS